MFKPNRDNRGAGILLEILMIVVGINIALWFESWFQDLQDAEIEERYLADLRDDLLTDIRNFFVYTEQDTGTMVAMYRLARSQSEDLVDLIEGELAL